MADIIGKISRDWENMNIPRAFILDVPADRLMDKYDMDIWCGNFNDIEEVTASLAKYGLILKHEKRLLDILVIRDVETKNDNITPR